MTSTGESVWSDRRVCLLATAAMAAIIVYGSLLPFDLSAPGSVKSDAWLEQPRSATVPLAWRTDFLVNFVTGAPLGFFLMGALQSPRPRRRMDVAFGLLVVGCGSAVLGAILELLQLLSATRISSSNDVLAQVAGASVGAVTWALGGPAVMMWLRRIRDDREPFGFVARLLQFYVPIFVIMQLRPVDAQFLTGRTALLPVTFDPELTFAVLRDFAGNALLAAPLGVLAMLTLIRAGRRRCAVPAAHLLGVSGVIALELARTIIWSAGVDMIDVLAGVLGVAMGIHATQWTRRCADRLSDPSFPLNQWVLAATGCWLLVLVASLLYPFHFELKPEVLRFRLHHIPFIPFASYYPSYSEAPVSGVRELLRRFLLGVPLGLLLHLAWPAAHKRSDRALEAVITIAVATTLFLGLAIAELFVPSGYPDITEIMLGAAGAALGVQLFRRFPVDTSREATRFAAPGDEAT